MYWNPKNTKKLWSSARWGHMPHIAWPIKYEIALSADEKTLTKKLAMAKLTRHRIAVDESRIIYTNNNNQAVTIFSEYSSEIPSYFNIKKPGQVKDLRNVSGLDREKLRRQFNVKATNEWFLSPKIYYSTVIHMLQNHRVAYADTIYENLHASQYYHDNADKNFFKFCNYIKTIRGENLIHFSRNMYIYQKKNITVIFLTKLLKNVTYIYQIFILIISVITWLVLFLCFQKAIIFKTC